MRRCPSVALLQRILSAARLLVGVPSDTIGHRKQCRSTPRRRA
jgi:hypothetical protein